MPHLRIRRLASEPELFAPIEFHDGLNIILGEKYSDTETRGRKVNGVGKTLCVEFIQFGLLKKFADSRLAKVPKDVLGDDQVVILHVEIGAYSVRIARQVGDHARPIISIDGKRGRMMNSLGDGLELLSSLLFGNIEVVARPSFRELLSLLARDEDSEFTDILTEGNYPANLRPHLYLLGLPLAIYDELRRIRTSVRDAKKLAKRFKDRFTEDGSLTVNAARAELNKAQSGIAEISTALNALEAEPAIALRQEELLEIETDLDELRARRQGINYELSQIASIPQFEQVDDRDIELLYNSFRDGLGSLLARELREVVSFKQKIEDFQAGLLDRRRAFLTTERSDLNKRISGLSRKYAELVRSIDKGGVLSELKLGLRAAQEQSAEYYSRREAERNYRDAQTEVDENKDEWNEMSSDFRKALEELESAIRSVETTILWIHEQLMGDRSASFDIAPTPQLSRSEPLQFSLRIRDDGSHSVERTKVFIYDWALLTNEGVAQRHPGFLLHDNIFDVDQDTLVRSLNFIHEAQQEGLEFQYILTLNRDKIENEERRKEIRFDVEQHRVARFTKEAPFLGRSYQQLATGRT